MAGLIPEIIIPRIKLDLCIVNVGDLRTYLIEEMSVMRYNDNGIFEICQKLFKPSDSIQIKVVGRLVKKKDVRISEKCFCKEHLHLFVSSQILHKLVMKFRINSKTVQELCSIGLGFPSVHLCKLRLKVTGTVSVLFTEIFFGIDRLFFLHDVIKLLIPHDNGLNSFKLIILEMVLLKD